jgi:deoxyribodipyrimidine photolyase-related protein
MGISIGFIFPNQLFDTVPIAAYVDQLFLIEYTLFFGEKKNIANFHQNKLVLHRASMKSYYENELSRFDAQYIDYTQSDFATIFGKFTDVTKIVTYEPKDFLLEKRIKKYCQDALIALEFIPNPGFLTPPEIYNEYFQNRKYFMTPFYIEQRKRLHILVDQKGKPLHDKWTFDSENRQKLPKNVVVPLPQFFGQNQYVAEAKTYVAQHFAHNLGDTNHFIYPTTRQEAQTAVQVFLAERFAQFGPYEDAISTNHVFNFHSLLSASLNIGLITPREVVDETLQYAAKNNVPFASLEGFIRQIIGWREFMMIVYERDGVKERNANFFQHKRTLPSSFYNGTTGIKPVDDAIKKALKYGYSHHIERLMILGNFMCLCEVDPHEIYRWFMEFYIDAYDWVMVPNVYGMSQYADGGLITTKPYISASNYILKMSDYSKNDPWCEIWDGLFWRFLHKNSATIAANSRMGMLLKSTDMTKHHAKIAKAELFLNENFPIPPTP